MVAIPIPSLRFKAREAKPEKIRYETVVVYDLLGTEPIAHLVELPGPEIQQHLDHRSRYKPMGGGHLVIGILLGTGVATAALFGLWFLLEVPPVVALVFSIFQAAPIGAPVGWILSRKFAPKPIWVMRRDWMIEEEGDEQHQEMFIESVIHSRFLQQEYVIQEWEDSEGKHERTVPQVYRATSTYEMTEARDEREDYKSRSGGWEKVELGLVAVLALASIGLFILFALATSEPPPG